MIKVIIERQEKKEKNYVSGETLINTEDSSK